MNNIQIDEYTPTTKDYERVDSLLTAYSRNKGGVDYKHVKRVFSDDIEEPHVKLEADFLSWGTVTLDQIEIVNTQDLPAAVHGLLQNIRQVAQDARMGSIVIENTDPVLGQILIEQGFSKSDDIRHFDGLHKNFFVQSLEPTGAIDLSQAEKAGIKLENSTTENTYARAFTAKNKNTGQTYGELIAFYTPMGELEIERLYVDNNTRGLGIGTKLIDAVVGFAEDAYMRSIIVASPTWQQGRVDNRKGFYEKRQFERLALIKLNLNGAFNDKTQYNVYYKIDLQDTQQAPVVSKDHLFAFVS